MFSIFLLRFFLKINVAYPYDTCTVFFIICFCIFMLNFWNVLFLKMSKYTHPYIYRIILVPYPWSRSWFSQKSFFPLAIGEGGGSFFALKDYHRYWFGSVKWSYSCWTKTMKLWKWREHLDKLEDGLLSG